MTIRNACALLALVLAGTACTHALAPPTPAREPRLPRAAVRESAPAANEVTLRLGETVVHAGTGLSVSVLAIDDRRCSSEVTCIWAGHARVRLRVGLPGEPAREVEVGTAAPPQMRLPYDACHAGLRLHLQALDSASNPVPRVMLRVLMGCSRVSRAE